MLRELDDKNMKITVVIPTFNKLSYLKVALNSLCYTSFNFKDFEVIVCNDGSTCSMEPILTNNYPFQLKVLSLPRKGRSYARNAGIEEAKGELIVFSDDDTILDSEFLTNHWKGHDGNDRNVILGERRQLYLKELPKESSSVEESRDLTRYMYKYSKCNIFNSQVTEKLLKIKFSRHWICTITGNMSINRIWLEHLGAFDEEFKGWGLEDIELGYKLSRSGFFFCYEPFAKNFHIEHPRNKKDMIKEMQINATYFYNKYHRPEDIRLFWEFYSGRISLSEFDKVTFKELGSGEESSSYFTLFKRSNLKPLS
jgi:glycosyltransferase involved in cell wall biosynthesis